MDRAGTLPQTSAPWTTLFNRPAFHALHLGAGETLVTAEHRDGDRVVGSTAGVLAGTTLTCGHRAPFAGLDFARPRETPARVAATVEAALATFAAAGAETVRLRLRGPAYGDTEAYVLYELLNRGFTVERADLTFALDLTATPTPATYRAALKSPARRALGHLEAGHDVRFAELVTDEDWRDGHALLAANRAAKGRALSLDVDYVLRQRAALPGALRLFALELDGLRCAAALIYVTAPGCWYVYAWGDARHALDRSPMNLLASHVVAAALEAGVTVLDLGTSSVPPAPGERLVCDDGLVQFKASVLARPHSRLTLVR